MKVNIFFYNYRIMLFTLCLIVFNACYQNKEEYLNGDCNLVKVKDSKLLRDSSYPIEMNNNYLNIKSIRFLSDTFFLRVHHSSKINFGKFFEYSFYKGTESFKVYSFPVDPRSGEWVVDRNPIDISRFLTTFNNKQKGKHFFTTLKDNHILELDDSSKFKRYVEQEGYSYPVIEISNECEYKLIVLTDPYFYRKKHIEAKYVSAFLEYLENEFGL